MKRVIVLMIIVGFLMGYTNQAAAGTYHIPLIINILVDASGSVTEQEFWLTNRMIADFTGELHQRAHRNPGERADWISVNWFGNHDQYRGTRFVNGSHCNDMKALQDLLLRQEHPRHNYTAIYSAIVEGTNEVIQLDRRLPELYAKVVIVVTDGRDNKSPQRVKNEVKRFYPNEDFFLVVIGVGNKADIYEFSRTADEVVRIDRFDDLLDELLRVLDVIPYVYNLN